MTNLRYVLDNKLFEYLNFDPLPVILRAQEILEVSSFVEKQPRWVKDYLTDETLSGDPRSKYDYENRSIFLALQTTIDFIIRYYEDEAKLRWVEEQFKQLEFIIKL